MKALPWLKWTVLAWVSVIAVCSMPARAEQPSVDDYTRNKALGDVAISPSGKRLAVTLFGKNGMRRLGVMDLDPLGQPRIVGAFDDADVVSVQWVTDDRLVFEAFQRGAEIKDGGAGTFVVDHDGTDQRQLIAWRRATGDIPGTAIASRVLPYGWFLHSVVGDGSDDVFVLRRVRDSIGDFKEVQMARMNTRTRELRNLSAGLPDYTSSVHFDTASEPRMAIANRAGRTKVFWRAAPGSAWAEIADLDGLKEDFEPWHVDADGTVLIQTRVGDTLALHKFDPASKKVDPQPVLQVKGFDLDSSPEVDMRTRRLVGLHFRTDRRTSYWFDEGLARIQKGVDAALPAGRSNRLYCGECETSRFIVVRSSSDRQPGEYYLYDRKNQALQVIGAERPWIDEKTQGRRSFHRFEARDGLTVPIYVTHPVGYALDKPLPAVVLVHGGPFVRGGDLGWDAWAQFFASRGYRVLQPEFRGSTGFGFSHFKAGWKEWGHGMLNDMADAVQWAAKQGLVDPVRVCITGASYGGYAALMSTISQPGVYRCAASFVGVTDLTLMRSVTWSDMPQEPEIRVSVGGRRS